MKIKYFISFIIISLALFGLAAGAQNIQYPVEELGDCQDESACRSYCDKPENAKSCIAFAEKNNLMSEEEIKMAKKFMAAGSKGPGGCKGKNECEAYCNNIDRIDGCIAFAEENNLMPPEELAEAKKVQDAIKRGVKPPACGNKKQCDIYCDQQEHMEECIAFGAEAGFIQGGELEDAKKMLAAVKKGVKPPPCRGKKACDAYCGNPENMEVCMTFAMEAGFMNEQDKADSQKMLQALKKGIKPPNCRGKDGCDVYCAQEQNFSECTTFAEAAGFMTSGEAAMARKTGGRGPGNCKGKDECEAFCNNPDNQEICFNFAKENGVIPEADLKQMEEGKQRFQESLQQAPSAALDCLNSEIGTDLMEKFKSGAAMPPREVGDKMRGCFEKMRGEMGPPPGMKMPEGMIPPPGKGMMPPAPGAPRTGPMPMPGVQPNMPFPPQENQERTMPFQSQMPPGEFKPLEGFQPSPEGFQPPMDLPMMPPGKGMMLPAPGTGPNMPLPSTMPGTGGGFTPEEFVPFMAPPTEPTAPAPQSSNYNFRNPLRATIDYFAEILSE